MVKYSTETYTSRYDYTPCEKVVDNKTFVSNIPDSLETELGTIQLFDSGDFIPQLSVYWEFAKNKGEWKHCKRTDWYTHLATGIKVRLEVIRSHSLDYKNPEMGWEKQTLTVKIPIPQSDGRGKNPNSHHNKPKIDGVTRDVKLTPEQWSRVEALGNGKGYSQGIRNLLQNI